MRLIFQHSILLTRVSSARGTCVSSVRVSPWLSVGVASVSGLRFVRKLPNKQTKGWHSQLARPGARVLVRFLASRVDWFGLAHSLGIRGYCFNLMVPYVGVQEVVKCFSGFCAFSCRCFLLCVRLCVLGDSCTVCTRVILIVSLLLSFF